MNITSRVFISRDGFMLLYKKVTQLLESNGVAFSSQHSLSTSQSKNPIIRELASEFIKLDEYFAQAEDEIITIISLIQKYEKVKKLDEFTRIYNKQRKTKNVSDHVGEYAKLQKQFVKLRGAFLTYNPFEFKEKISEKVWFYEIYCLCILVDEDAFRDEKAYFQKLNNIYGISQSLSTNSSENNADKKSLSNYNVVNELPKEELDFEDSSMGTSYKVYYFSELQNEAGFFNLKIFFNAEPPKYKTERQEYAVIEKGFHDKSGKPIYDGYAFKMQESSLRLHLVLQNEKRTDKLKMVLGCGDNPNKSDHMFGALMARSADNTTRYILSYEILAIKKSFLEKYPKISLQIKRYFALTRNVFQANTNTQIGNLEAKNVSVTRYSSLEGYWRIWRFNSRYEKIIQSVMYIRDDYRTYCITNQFPDKSDNIQACIFNINNANDLTINCMSYRGNKIMSTMFLQSVSEDNPLQIKGVMVTVGRNLHKPRMRAFAMIREENWENNFPESDGDFFTSKKIGSLIKDLEPISEGEINLSNSKDKALYKLLRESIEDSETDLPDWFLNIK